MTQDSPEINELALPPGFALGNYIIRRVIGQGGFGITYLAVDQDLQTEVVIKENMPGSFAGRSTTSRQVFSLSHASDDFAWARDRFIQEARTMAKLNHRNIVRVTRVFQALGTAYYVMPYVGGMSLDKIVSKEGPLSEARLRPLLVSLLEALQYLHGKELLHRDIKPANILLDEEGEPILIDFGAARQLSQHSQTVVESPGYTPFEQMQTRGKIGPWTDLYALGGTMYKLITGETPMRSMDRVGEDTLAPLADRADLRKSYSRSFLKGIDKALTFNARKRWQTAEEWQQSLNADRKTSSTSRRPASTEVSAAADEQIPPPRKRKKLILLWSAAVTVLVGVVSLRDDLLCVSCRYGNKTMASLMLTIDADTEAKDNYDRTPLFWAAYEGHEAIVRMLLEKGANTEAKGDPPLIGAACKGHEAVVRLLLEKGANINAKDKYGDTPLIGAASEGHESVVRMLLEKGANTEAKNNNGWTPLFWAAYNGHEAIVRMLLEKGANTEAKGDPPLIGAACKGHEAVVRLLLEKGANINAKDKYGDTPLIGAASEGHESVVRMLLEKGANTEAKNNNGWTPLYFAAYNGHEAVVRLLLEKGANIEAKTNIGWTPLIEAAIEGHEAVVRLLLEKGADPRAKTNAGDTAYDRAKTDSIKRLIRSYQR